MAIQCNHVYIADHRESYPYGILYGSFSPTDQDKFPSKYKENTEYLMEYLARTDPKVKIILFIQRDGKTFSQLRDMGYCIPNDIKTLRQEVYQIVKHHKDVITEGFNRSSLFNLQFKEMGLSAEAIRILNSAGFYSLVDFDRTDTMSMFISRMRKVKNGSSFIVPVITALKKYGYDTTKFGYPSDGELYTKKEDIFIVGKYNQAKTPIKEVVKEEKPIVEEIKEPKKEDKFIDLIKQYVGRDLSDKEFSEFKGKIHEYKTMSAKKARHGNVIFSDQKCRDLLKEVGYNFFKFKNVYQIMSIKDASDPKISKEIWNRQHGFSTEIPGTIVENTLVVDDQPKEEVIVKGKQSLEAIVEGNSKNDDRPVSAEIPSNKESDINNDEKLYSISEIIGRLTTKVEEDPVEPSKEWVGISKENRIVGYYVCPKCDSLNNLNCDITIDAVIEDDEIKLRVHAPCEFGNNIHFNANYCPSCGAKVSHPKATKIISGIVKRYINNN